MPKSKIVRTSGLGDGVTVAVTRMDECGWLIALSDSIEEDSVAEQLAMATARKTIAAAMLGFIQPEGGVDCLDLSPAVAGPRLDLVPPPQVPHWASVRPEIAAAAVAPLTALSYWVAHFDHVMTLPGFTG